MAKWGEREKTKEESSWTSEESEKRPPGLNRQSSYEERQWPQIESAGAVVVNVAFNLYFPFLMLSFCVICVCCQCCFQSLFSFLILSFCVICVCGVEKVGLQIQTIPTWLDWTPQHIQRRYRGIFQSLGFYWGMLCFSSLFKSKFLW